MAPTRKGKSRAQENKDKYYNFSINTLSSEIDNDNNSEDTSSTSADADANASGSSGTNNSKNACNINNLPQDLLRSRRAFTIVHKICISFQRKWLFAWLH